jgi:hypothetical protein
VKPRSLRAGNVAEGGRHQMRRALHGSPGRGPAQSRAECLLPAPGGGRQSKKLALTAAMRKLVVILNALVRDGQPWRAPQSA